MRSALRPLAPVAIAAFLLAGLAGCAGDGGGTGSGGGTDDCDAAPSGSVSDAVQVTDGAEGEAPEVAFESPIEVETTQRTVLTEGEGDPLTDADSASIAYVILNGANGEVLETTGYDGQTISVPLDGSVIAGLTDTLLCSTVGSRVVGVIPPAEGFGDQGQQLGLETGDNIVVVADVVEPTAPDLPAPEEWTDNLPTVDLESDPPVVTLPAGDAPAGLLLAVLEEGDGDEVTAADSPSLDYQGTSWSTREVFDQSYGGDPIALPATGYVPGFSAAIIGQKVGSTLLVSIPAELAYGADPAAHQLGGQALLFLIQIRDIG